MLLAIDTCGPSCAIALSQWKDGSLRVIDRTEERIGRGHAERLMPILEAALERSGTTYRDIHKIAVTTGPGSFTGIRIGLAAGRGLALALKCDIVGVSVLDGLLWPVEADEGTLVAATLDARREQIFAAMKQGVASDVMAPCVTSVDRLSANIMAMDAGCRSAIKLVGSAASMIQSALARNGLAASVENEHDSADILAISEMAWLDQGTGRPDPFYCREPDAKPQSAIVQRTDEAV